MEVPSGNNSFCFSNKSYFFTPVNYLVDNLPENIKVSKSKFKQVVFKLFNFVFYKDNTSTIIDLENMETIVI